MAKPGNDDSFPEKQTWGTWEELLLACAVHRHGTESWSSVSAEIQKRSPNLCSLTASACRHKYLDLKRRFAQEMALQGSDEVESVAEISTVPWLEELRRLRVDELRREVEQYDLSISSLQSKVKRLEEEREMSLDEADTGIENSDLLKIAEKKELCRESDCDSGELVPKPLVLLVKESIPPDPKENSPGTGSANVKREEEMAGGVVDGGEAKPTGEDSCGGSCESVEKEPGANSERVEPGRGTEFAESMAESEGGVNRGEEEWKETSDVQSSASLPTKATSGLDNEDQSPSAKDFPVESQPSVCFVEILLSHPCGSHFSRRLETQLQETPGYGNIIRQHVDFEIIRKRVEEGCYKSSMSKLFRDLLLLINNAKVFYHKGSSEFKSAEQIHQLVKKQMTTTLKRPREISPPKEKSLELVAFKEAVAVSSKPISVKPRMSVPIIACRKRSSLAAKPLISPSGADKKSKKADQVFDDEKPVSGKDETSGKDDESPIWNKTTRGKTSSAKNVAIRYVKNRDSSLNVDDDNKGRVSNEVEKTDDEKKGNNSSKSGSSKKKSAANFLKRMKGGSSPDTVVETLKPSSATDSSTTGKGAAEQRKNNSNKGDAKKRAATTGENQTNEKGSPVKKKNSGRALKREAAPSSSSSPALAKRSRETGEKKAASSPSSTRLKKRVRR